MFDPIPALTRSTLAMGLFALAACGGGGGGGGGGSGFNIPDPTLADLPPGVDARAALFTAASDRLDARSNTAFIEPYIEGMPSSGSAEFVGILYALSATPGENTELYGQANVTAYFGSGTMSGIVSDFWGLDRTGSEAFYAGTVNLTNGDIAVDRRNDFTLDYSGDLSGNGEAVSLSGTLDGDFKADPILGILAIDIAPDVEIDTTPYTSVVALTAERVPN